MLLMNKELSLFVYIPPAKAPLLIPYPLGLVVTKLITPNTTAHLMSSITTKLPNNNVVSLYPTGFIKQSTNRYSYVYYSKKPVGVYCESKVRVGT